jgi:hypothetical protein
MKRQKDIKKGEGNMRYKFELSIMIAVVFGLSLAGVASADSVTKTLYVDGVKVGTSAASQAISFPNPRLTIGAEGSRYYRYNGLVGEIDEFAVFDRVLTDANVTDLFNAGPTNYAEAVGIANPLLYLQFEEGSSGDGDKLTNSGSLADVNSTYIGAVTQNAGGYAGKSAILHGATDGNGDCIDVCDWDGRLYKTDVSVAFWVKTTQNSDYPRLFQHNGGDGEQRSYGAMYNAGTNAIGLIGGGSTGYVNSTINDGQWHHIVVTFDSIKPRPYATEVMADDPCVYLKFDNSLMVDSSENHYWAMYSSEAQIRRVLGAIGGKALYLDNSGTGSTARAYVWNNYGGMNFREFPGWTDYWDDAYAFAPGDITFEFWMKSTPELTPATYAILFQQHGSNTREPNAPGMGLSGTNPAALRICGGSQWWYPGVNAPLDGKWHHVVVTYDENEVNPGLDMGIELYLDGTRYSTTITDPNNYQALLGPELYILMIGAANNLGYGWSGFGGYIDEFAVYAGVLSADRVAAHYAAGQPSSAGWPVDCADVWAKRLGLTGDLNQDCFVDFLDFAIFADDWRAQ